MPSPARSDAGGDGAGILIGEVHTGLLLNSASLRQDMLPAVLGLLPGERVRSFERPISHAVSPELLVGVDCDLSTASGTRVRGIGTLAVRAAITGGRVLQGSAWTRLMGGHAEHRLPWSHYLARPGVVETVGRRRNHPYHADLADGFLDRTNNRKAPGIDFGAICGQIMGEVQRSPYLDRRSPFKAARTTLRWVAEESPERRIGFILGDDGSRTTRITFDGQPISAVIELCEDLALHDWLLSTLLDVIDRGMPSDGPHETMMRRIRPAVDHLIHLWMPGARVVESLLPLWESLDTKPGFTRQWDTLVNRIRDQLALRTLTLLSASAEGVPGRNEQGIRS
ncbi:SCO2521 family protein [Actinoallomurus spadix]|uniref:SCO2521 family protein n=1 Tax=Actinoallomurus spadix TaxID=79912 RepID=A0ABN0XBG6_9ACTN|nr:SCO2521 family protein [Actinoallomurus spadix]MCO5987746.1 SCO2521 family protein [Actinoallomurus spadix]